MVLKWLETFLEHRCCFTIHFIEACEIHFSKGSTNNFWKGTLYKMVDLLMGGVGRSWCCRWHFIGTFWCFFEIFCRFLKLPWCPNTRPSYSCGRSRSWHCQCHPQERERQWWRRMPRSSPLRALNSAAGSLLTHPGSHSAWLSCKAPLAFACHASLPSPTSRTLSSWSEVQYSCSDGADDGLGELRWPRQLTRHITMRRTGRGGRSIYRSAPSHAHAMTKFQIQKGTWW